MESPTEQQRRPVSPTLAAPKTSTNVQVVVRCRPSSTEERNRSVAEIVQVDSLSDEVRVTAPIKAGEKVFNFDRVFGPQSTQLDVYEKSVEPLVQQTLRGYNTTVLAYGQTGTGKTHTMEGEFDDPTEMGIIPRAMQSIFRTLDLKNDTESYVKASYLEIYNENLTDLLSSVPANQELPPHQQLRLVDDKSKTSSQGRGAVIVHNLEEVLVKSYEDVRRVMKFAMSKRKVASTDLNERSSRSHAVFTVTVHSKELSPDGEELLRVGKLNLVDLAGSECVARSGSKDIRAREAGNINQSLLTLGRVITALVEKSPHISYRDSKLTRVLQESLGGCSLTLMIATVAPSVICLDETLSTLEYASRAKAIKNKPVANQKMTKRAAIKDYVEEIERLRQELQSARAKDGVFLSEEQYNAMQIASKSTSLRVAEVEALVEKRNTELRDMRASYATIKLDLNKTTNELETERAKVLATREELKRKQQELVEERMLVEEKQAIVDAHALVEQRLHQIHDELQDRLRVAKDRIAVLHDKLDHKQVLERENERNVSKLHREVESKLGEIDMLVRGGQAVSLESSAKIGEMLGRFQALLGDEFAKSSTMHRNQLLAGASNALKETLDAIGKHVHNDREREEHTSKANAEAFSSSAQAFAQSSKLHQRTIEMSSAAHAAEVTMLRNECIAPLVAELERTKRSERALIESLSLALCALREATAELVSEYDCKLADMRLHMLGIVAKEKERSRKASEKAAARVAMMLTGLQDECDDQLDNLMHQLAVANKDCSTKVSQRAATMDTCLNIVLRGNETWISSETEMKQACEMEARQNDALALANAKEAQVGVLECSVETDIALQSGMKQANAAHLRVDASSKTIINMLRERQVQANKDCAAMEHNLAAMAQSAQVKEMQLEQRGAHMVALTKQEVDDLRANTVQFCDASLHTVQNSLGLVEGFHFSQDQTTGKTPSKAQVLEWTKERPRTSPHSMIVERVRSLRTERKQANPVTPDMEDISFSTRKKKTAAGAAGGVLLTERDCNVTEDKSEDYIRSNTAASKEKVHATNSHRRFVRLAAATGEE